MASVRHPALISERSERRTSWRCRGVCLMLGSEKKPLVLLTGRTGQIRSELEKYLAPIVELTALDRRQFDLENPDAARDIIRRIGPKIIVHAAGYTGDHP